jgi:hypothetical protein
VTKFKIGDVITNGPNYSYKVIDVVVGERRVTANWWSCGVKEKEISNSYVLEDVADGMCCHLMFFADTHWHVVPPEVLPEPDVVAVATGDTIEVRHVGNYRVEGPYEIVETVYSSRYVSYFWRGTSAHPRQLSDCWIARDEHGEHIVLPFSDTSKIKVLTRDKHAGFCPRCGGKMVEKTSHGFIGESEFKVKKCATCGNCL